MCGLTHQTARLCVIYSCYFSHDSLNELAAARSFRFVLKINLGESVEKAAGAKLGVVALGAYQLCYADLFETFVINIFD